MSHERLPCFLGRLLLEIILILKYPLVRQELQKFSSSVFAYGLFTRCPMMSLVAGSVEVVGSS